MIRVIGGKYKGKRLRRIPSSDVRPMPAKLKESLFNIIQPDLKNAVFLDGFAGTGSVGIEALSRGARLVIFVDESYTAAKTIKDNLIKCDAEESARIIHKEFNRGVILLAKEEAKFDLVFLDPPYKLLEERDPLKVIKKRDVLNENGTIILRHHFKTCYKAKYYDPSRQVNIGDDTLSFFR